MSSLYRSAWRSDPRRLSQSMKTALDEAGLHDPSLRNAPTTGREVCCA